MQNCTTWCYFNINTDKYTLILSHSHTQKQDWKEIPNFISGLSNNTNGFYYLSSILLYFLVFLP